MGKEIIILDCSPNGIEGSNRHIIQWMNKKCVHPHLIKLCPNGQWLGDRQLYDECAKIRPDLILWDGVMPWRYSEVLKKNECRKVNLWFDDPVMRIEGLDFVDRVKECAKREDFEFHIWDSYWQERCEKLFGIKSSLIHLSADEDEYYPSDTQLSDECVFIGGLHSKSEIEKRIGWCNPIFKKVIKSSLEYVSGLSIESEIPPWDYVENLNIKSLGTGDLKLYREMKEMDPGQHLQLRWCIWAHSKNEVRIKALKEVLKVSKLLIFTDTKQKGHANEDEIKYMLEDYGDNLKVVDTSDVHASKLGNLYHYGALHIGSTDPQSVHTGIPYRVFQTMASGRPLLTDEKPGWGDFLGNNISSSNYISYSNPTEIAEKIPEAIKNGKELGESARSSFEMFHTWPNRLQYIIFKHDTSYEVDQIVKNMTDTLQSMQHNLMKDHLKNVGNFLLPGS